MLRGIIEEIVREHVQLAAFQWAQHKMLKEIHPPDLVALSDVHSRLCANLDAIEIAGKAAWPFIIDQIEDFPEAGEIFVAGYLAIARRNERRIRQCLGMAHQHPESRAGLAGALAWFSPEISGPTVREMLDSRDEVQRAVAIDVLAQHRADAGRRLAAFLVDPSAMVRASACALASATGRIDCSDAIVRLLKVEDPELRFAAATALVRLDRIEDAAVHLQAEVAANGVRAKAALRILSETMDQRDFRAYLGVLFGREDTRPLAVRGVAMLADPGDIDWMIEQMREPTTAVAAADGLIEVFPEAAAVDGLFRELTDLPETPYTPDEFANADRYPDAGKIRRWMDEARSGGGLPE